MTALPREYSQNGFGPLPDGWSWTRLDAIVTPYDGHWGEELEFPGAKAVTVLGVGNVSSEGHLRLEGSSKRYFAVADYEAILQEGDLTVVKSSGSASNIRSGKTAICPAELSGTIACSNFMIKLEPKRDRVVPKLLWFLLNSQYAKSFIRLIAGSTTYPNIKWQSLRDFTVPLPALDEQRRIVARLNEQMAQIEKARAALTEQDHLLRVMSEAVLDEVFTGTV